MPARTASAATPEFVPIKTQRAFEIICEQIRRELAQGTLKVGDKLPPERELAVQFQVSRNVLREALRSLEVAGIIRNVKGAKGGAFVQAADADRITQAMQDFIHLGSISLGELTEARIALQDVIVRLACARATEKDLNDLEAIAESTRSVTDVEARLRCAVEYYATLARATQNRMFGVLVEALSSIFHNFVREPGYELLQDALHQSRMRLVRHLRDGDCDAAAAEMHKHLQRVHRHVRKNLKAADANSKQAARPRAQ
jgi:DNA-binding FadR family transcriptional regulator